MRNSSCDILPYSHFQLVKLTIIHHLCPQDYQRGITIFIRYLDARWELKFLRQYSFVDQESIYDHPKIFESWIFFICIFFYLTLVLLLEHSFKIPSFKLLNLPPTDISWKYPFGIFRHLIQELWGSWIKIIFEVRYIYEAGEMLPLILSHNLLIIKSIFMIGADVSLYMTDK